MLGKVGGVCEFLDYEGSDGDIYSSKIDERRRWEEVKDKKGSLSS